jgi:hypothetical protein
MLGIRVARFFLAQNTKTRKIHQNDHKIYPISVKYNKRPCPQNIPTSSNARPSKIYPNLDFWFENKPYFFGSTHFTGPGKIQKKLIWIRLTT